MSKSDEYAQDAYDRLQKMLGATNAKPTKVIPDIFLDKEDELYLFNALNSKLIKQANLPEYHANLLSDNLIGIIQEFFNFKVAKTRQKLAEDEEKARLKEIEREDESAFGPLYITLNGKKVKA